jgi:hypothetical protein
MHYLCITRITCVLERSSFENDIIVLLISAVQVHLKSQIRIKKQ